MATEMLQGRAYILVQIKCWGVFALLEVSSRPCAKSWRHAGNQILVVATVPWRSNGFSTWIEDANSMHASKDNKQHLEPARAILWCPERASILPRIPLWVLQQVRRPSEETKKWASMFEQLFWSLQLPRAHTVFLSLHCRNMLTDPAKSYGLSVRFPRRDAPSSSWLQHTKTATCFHIYEQLAMHASTPPESDLRPSIGFSFFRCIENLSLISNTTTLS
jgi:hypothetical protein